MSTELTVIPQEQSFGGGLEGAERTSRETLSWRPTFGSPDMAINGVKEEADARSRDLVLNDGFSQGGVSLHKDSIVGAQYRLNAKPDYRVLGATAEWAEEFSIAAESRFNLAAESEDCWFDASGTMTFTGMVRLIVGAFVYTGEVLATCEWIKDGRPFNTAIQLVSPDRLSNPDGVSDDRFLRRGVRKNARGRPVGYYIRQGHPQEWYDNRSLLWNFVPVAKPWGRKQVIHIIEPAQIDQTRGIAEMVAALKHARRLSSQSFRVPSLSPLWAAAMKDIRRRSRSISGCSNRISAVPRTCKSTAPKSRPSSLARSCRSSRWERQAASEVTSRLRCFARSRRRSTSATKSFPATLAAPATRA
jgi:capsid protein